MADTATISAEQLSEIVKAAVRSELVRLGVAKAQWVTIEEAAKRLNCSRATINRKVRAGELEARGSGATRMVRL